MESEYVTHRVRDSEYSLSVVMPDCSVASNDSLRSDLPSTPPPAAALDPAESDATKDETTSAKAANDTDKPTRFRLTMKFYSDYVLGSDLCWRPYNSEDELPERHKTLQSCALVSNAWRIGAQQALYANKFIHVKKRSDLLDMCKPHSAVIKYALNLGFTQCDDGESATNVSDLRADWSCGADIDDIDEIVCLGDAIDLIARCTKLQSIAIEWQSSWTHLCCTKLIKDVVLRPTVTWLKIDMPQQAIVPISLLKKLLRMLPGLRMLMFVGLLPMTLDDDIPVDLPRLFHFVIRTDVWQEQADDMTALVTNLLSPSTLRSITSLHLGPAVNWTSRDLRLPFANSVTSFSLDGDLPPSFSFRNSTGLSRLEEIEAGTVMFDGPYALVDILLDLPQFVKSIVLPPMDFEDLMSVPIPIPEALLRGKALETIGLYRTRRSYPTLKPRDMASQDSSSEHEDESAKDESSAEASDRGTPAPPPTSSIERDGIRAGDEGTISDDERFESLVAAFREHGINLSFDFWG